jgi:D-alanyl-D-alanine dipeptidase
MHKKVIPQFIFVVFLFGCAPPQQIVPFPSGFVYLNEVIPDIQFDMRYYNANNFIGTQIDGYESHKCIISKDAAFALKNVQSELKEYGLCLKIFDAYRPQQAVDHFVRWTQDLTDTLQKTEYYPNVPKNELIPEYIASKSGHSRGSTIDLTIVSYTDSTQLDMGGTFDFFGDVSNVKFADITGTQRSNRMLLQTLMIRHGFKPYSKEWWHFTLQNEPFPNTYFNFPVK